MRGFGGLGPKNREVGNRGGLQVTATGGGGERKTPAPTRAEGERKEEASLPWTLESVTVLVVLSARGAVRKLKFLSKEEPDNAETVER